MLSFESQFPVPTWPYCPHHVAQIFFDMRFDARRHHHKIEPAGHGSNDPGNDSNTELSKEDVKDHKDELKHMQVLC